MMIQRFNPESRKFLASKVAERWKNRYFINKKWPRDDPNVKKIYEKLLSLGPNPNPEDVEIIIGNKSWTNPHCDDCRAIKLPLAIIHNDYTAISLCGDCLEKLYQQFHRESLN